MKLSLPLVSSMYEDAAFTVAAPKYWNTLPDELRTKSSFITFKSRLHSYIYVIIRMYYFLIYYYLCNYLFVLLFLVHRFLSQ